MPSRLPGQIIPDLLDSRMICSVRLITTTEIVTSKHVPSDPIAAVPIATLGSSTTVATRHGSHPLLHLPPPPFLHQTTTTSPSVEMENHASSTNDTSKDPASFLSSIIGVPVTVKLNSGVVYKGELQSVDGYMNIALEKCHEYVNGQMRRNYGDAFVRGNNGEFVFCSSRCYGF